MSEDLFRYDIFLSYNKHDESKVRAIRDQFEQFGLRAFFAPVDLRQFVGTDGWENRITDAIGISQHLGVYCSKDAGLSEWVKKEAAVFLSSTKLGPTVKRLVLAIPDPALDPDDLGRVVSAIELLETILRPRDLTEVLEIVAREKISRLSDGLAHATEELERAHDLAKQAFDYYRHARFWRPFSEFPGSSVHIFTCGRDTPEDVIERGSSGRTGIDKWDYQAAIDVTHHFARHHHDTGVLIEQPVSKARIDSETRAFDTSEFSRRLLNRNCIIIGAPDVSDFAEITLARLLQIEPYCPNTALWTGFIIHRKGKRFSTFYERCSDEFGEGITVIREGQRVDHFRSTSERDHGVVVLADNPFSEPEKQHKILILAGHSGVATRAISLLLTNEEPWCLDAFYDLDRQIATMEHPVAAVIEVAYRRVPRRSGVGDDREIIPKPDGIRVCSVISLAT